MPAPRQTGKLNGGTGNHAGPSSAEEKHRVAAREKAGEGGLRKGAGVRLVLNLILVSAGVLIFAFDDTPMRPYLITTAVVMGGIVIFWPWLKKRLG
jgi:hypothetical protein